MQATIKTIGSSGQISLGKQHAGKTVLVEEREDGVWLIKTGEFIPTNEMWLHEPEASGRLDRGLRWLASNPKPRDADLDGLEQQLLSDED